VDPDEFVRFSGDLDQPTCAAQDVGRSFEAFQVVRRRGDVGAVDIVEIMEVDSLREWERVCEQSAAVQPLAATFEALADAAAVGTIFASRIRRS
jgi:hypothetical protein